MDIRRIQLVDSHSASCGLGPRRRHARDLVLGGSDPSSQAQQFGNCVIEPSSSVEGHSQKRVGHRAQGAIHRTSKRFTASPRDYERTRNNLHVLSTSVAASFCLLMPIVAEYPCRKHQQEKAFRWCCGRGLNSRPLPYQGSALPLSYRSRPADRDGTGTILARRRRVPCHMGRGTASTPAFGLMRRLRRVSWRRPGTGPDRSRESA